MTKNNPEIDIKKYVNTFNNITLLTDGGLGDKRLFLLIIIIKMISQRANGTIKNIGIENVIT